MSTFFRDHIIVHALRREIAELYISVAIKNFALSMIALFEPIYLYQELGFSLSQVLLFFAVAYTLYFFLLPLGGKICGRFGFEHSILYSVPLIILYFGSLYLASSLPFLIYGAPLLLAFYKMLFWPAYHANFAHYGNFAGRGKEISRLGVLNAMVVVVGPLLGGLIITIFSFPVLFAVVAILMFVSIIPLFTTHEVFAPSRFSYKESFRRLFERTYRRYTLGFMGFAEELVALVVWPIFIFLILRTYLNLGALSSLSIFLTAILGLIIGRIVDREGVKRVLHFSTVGYSITWFLCLIVRTATEVFMINSLGHIFANGIVIPVQALVYNKGRERGSLNFAVFYEMALVLGKVLIAWILFFIFLYTQNMGISFVLAGLATLLYLLLK